MPNMRREQEHLASADRNISDNSLFDHFQHHVPAQLIEELVSGIVVEVDPLVGSAYDLDDHTALIKERLVADRRLEQIPVHVYPALEIKRTLHRYLPGGVPAATLRLSRGQNLWRDKFRAISVCHHNTSDAGVDRQPLATRADLRVEPGEGREWGHEDPFPPHRLNARCPSS